MFKKETLSKIIFFLKKKSYNGYLAIAFSGGIDSCCLLKFFRNFIKYNLILIYIKHSIVQLVCTPLCFMYGNIHVVVVPVCFSFKILKQKGLEGSMRLKRYNTISRLSRILNIKFVILGQHFNDYIETFFLILLSGRGQLGHFMKAFFRLNGICFLRPFLIFERSLIVNLVGGLSVYLDDLSNYDISIKRNLVRFCIDYFFKASFTSFYFTVSNFLIKFTSFIKT